MIGALENTIIKVIHTVGKPEKGRLLCRRAIRWDDETNLEQAGCMNLSCIRLEQDWFRPSDTLITIMILIYIGGVPEDRRQRSRRTNRWDVNNKTTQPLYPITRQRR
jgi:hypothetical protein